MRILVLLVVVTLVGSAATLVALGALLAPVRLTTLALKRYLDDQTKPDLPIGFSDEVGRLMADVRVWLRQLPRDLAERIAYGNAEALFGR